MADVDVSPTSLLQHNEWYVYSAHAPCLSPTYPAAVCPWSEALKLELVLIMVET